MVSSCLPSRRTSGRKQVRIRQGVQRRVMVLFRHTGCTTQSDGASVLFGHCGVAFGNELKQKVSCLLRVAAATAASEVVLTAAAAGVAAPALPLPY